MFGKKYLRLLRSFRFLDYGLLIQRQMMGFFANYCWVKYASYLLAEKHCNIFHIKVTLHKKMKFSIKSLLSKCDQIRSFL